MSEVQGWLQARRAAKPPSPKIGAVLELVATQPKLASYASAAQIAEQLGINTATVVRAAQAMGFAGWLDFRSEVRTRYLASLTAPEIAAEHSATAEHPATHALRQDLENVTMLTRQLAVPAVEAFAEAIDSATRTVVVAPGNYSSVGLPLAHLSTVMGYSVTLEMRGGSHLANALGKLESGDCLVAIGFWRLHAETVRAAKIAHNRGARVCVITDSSTSLLAQIADHTIVVPAEGSSWFPSLVTAISTVNAVLATLEARGGDQAQQSIAKMEHLWHEMELYSNSSWKD